MSKPITKASTLYLPLFHLGAILLCVGFIGLWIGDKVPHYLWWLWIITGGLLIAIKLIWAFRHRKEIGVLRKEEEKHG